MHNTSCGSLMAAIFYTIFYKYRFRTDLFFFAIYLSHQHLYLITHAVRVVYTAEICVSHLYRTHAQQTCSVSVQHLCKPSLGAVEYALLGDLLLPRVYEPSSSCESIFQSSFAEKHRQYVFHIWHSRRLLCYDVVLICTHWSPLYFHDTCFIFTCTATDILFHNFYLIRSNMLFWYVRVCVCVAGRESMNVTTELPNTFDIYKL